MFSPNEKEAKDQPEPPMQSFHDNKIAGYNVAQSALLDHFHVFCDINQKF